MTTMNHQNSFDRNSEEEGLAEYLIAQVVGRASGRIQSIQDECHYNPPRDVYFIGNLRPRPADNETPPTETTAQRELRNKLAPVAFGAEFKLKPRGTECRVEATVFWDCYYRVFPTRQQQLDYQNQQPTDDTQDEQIVPAIASETVATTPPTATATPSDGEENEDASLAEETEREDDRVEAESPDATDSVQDRRRTRRQNDALFIRFRKLTCRAEGAVLLRYDDQRWTADSAALQSALEAETARAQQQALADPEALRTDGDAAARITVPDTALASDAAYRAFLAGLTTPVVPAWRWEVQPQLRQDESEDLVFSLTLVNASPLQSAGDTTRRRDNPNIEPFLFDTKTELAFDELEVLPFELELAPRGFRYDRELWGRGFNCAVEHDRDNHRFATTHAPVHRQMRYTTSDQPRAEFAALAADPLTALTDIAEAMERYLDAWRAERARQSAQAPAWESQFGAEFDADQRKFEDELADFRRGLELLRMDADCRLAFQLTNETFRRAGQHPTKPKTAWRLFQIVFLVSQLPSMAALRSPGELANSLREQVDIIYFPTGGGKTEAYLATLIFHCFFDRLRGKTAGVTAWTRFPLRLLTLQQTQRVADVIGLAELLRRDHSDARLSGKGVAGFAVGYFVGSEATPNEIINAEQAYEPKPEVQAVWSQANDAQARQSWKRIATCPACRTRTVQVDFDPAVLRLSHRCTQPNCPFPKGCLPVYVVDNEIYRYLPSVIVGTIDKLASLGNQRKLAQVFGQVDGKCEVHGYYKGRCCQKDCRDEKRLKPGVPRGLSGPTLFIQDELHLLKEGLGTFDAHYETFAQELLRHFGQTAPLKLIASSATIEAFERQVEHLYGRRQARVFPGLGPTLGASFYAQTRDYPQRLFVGLLPHNKTIFNAILELIELYHRCVQDLLRLNVGTANSYGGAVRPGTPEWMDLLDPYVTSLTYFLANRELDSIRTDLFGDVIPNLERDGYPLLNPLDMTGGTSTDEVTKILERLEQRSAVNADADAVLATSMVSHGVDVDRFNAMVFYGMPRQTAEYIQASSRVGRAHAGIVFACLHPARERDQSHYTYFAKYHEFIGQLVEPVAINRWAKFSLQRTVPGLFMAVLLQILSNRDGVGNNGGRFYTLDFIKQQINRDDITAEQFIPLLKAAYLVESPTNVAETNFNAEVTQRVQRFLEQILNAAPGGFVSNALIPPPMSSLRDVDEALPIQLDSLGQRWANHSASRRR